jgi:hypothetical protein
VIVWVGGGGLPPTHYHLTFFQVFSPKCSMATFTLVSCYEFLHGFSND